MKTLYIIRHAKSSWHFDFSDHDRPLATRGRRDVLKIGKTLSTNEETPDLFISSSASRALYTALHIADEWGYPDDNIVMDPKLYHAGVGELCKVITSQTEADSIAIFGHNPGLTDLINKFVTEYVDNLPTCGVCALEFPIDSWSEIKNSKPRLKFLITPKRRDL